MDDISEFRLSRVQAEGWNAAHKFSGDRGDAKKIASLNPYSSDLERARWFAGFNNALERL